MKRMIIATAVAACTLPANAQQVDPEVFTLDNGMKFILLPRFEEPNNIAAGWVAKVGSVNERPGITGISHFFEHMMFKGTDIIGTTDPEKDAAYRQKERELRNRMLALTWGEQYDRYRAGEIADPWDAASDTPELASLRQQLQDTMEEHRSVIVKDEFASIYQEEGANGLNAFTTQDLTFYINGLPANKFELWCWMESDRLANSVFREFFSERDVVHEERRMRTESSPTGEFDEQFDAMFWQGSPYSWPVIGWPSDLNSYTLEEAQKYYDTYYRPNNLVGVVVGDFDPNNAKTMITEYFGRLEPGDSPPPPVVTIEPAQRAEQRLVGELDAQGQVEVRYHTPPIGHADSYPLTIMAAILNGRTGRLYKSMVEGREIASGAQAAGPIDMQNLRKYQGAFSFSASVKGDASPDDLESAWYEELSTLQHEPVGDRELQKIKNQVTADQYRSLQSNFFLMLQLGFLETFIGWEAINETSPKLLAVTADDIMRVANEYFDERNRSVALYYRSADAPEVDDALAALDAQSQAIVGQILAQLEPLGPDELREAAAEMATQAASVPPEFQPAFEYVSAWIKSRLVELDAEAPKGVSDTPPPTPAPASESVELTPEQLAQAQELMMNFATMPVADLREIYTMLQASYPGVPDDEKPIIDYVLAHLAVHIAEQDQLEEDQ
ncbi:MAG: pitrilysin family protein [Phycisphaerales bacterium]|nr:pitrilysin family protein [Phycisphaerales bacterium]